MGSPTAERLSQRYRSPHEAFRARTERQGECLVWTGAKIRGGYGQMWAGGKVVLVHRWAWIEVNGPVPVGMEVDHVCHNAACANITHLRLANRSQNMQNLGGAMSNNRSGVRNVTQSRYGTFMVRITKDGSTHYFGSYPTLDEASKVADRERSRLFGSFSGRS